MATITTEATTTSSSPESLRADGRLAPEAAASRIASLFQEQARLVLRICRSMLRDRVEAEDAAQQTFLSAYASLLAGRVPRDDVAWLATIARNECRARIRARMCEPLVALDEDGPVAGDDVQAIAIRRSEIEAVRRGLVDLPSQQRQALVLREFAGLSYEELAESLSVSLASVESLLFRARRGLRSRLEPAFAGVNGVLSIPLVLRDLLLRLASGGGESAGAAAKIASLPVAAKLAAAGASAALVAGGAVGMEVRSERAPARHPAVRAVTRPIRAPAPRPQPAPAARVAAHIAAPPAAVLVAARHESPPAHGVSRHARPSGRGPSSGGGRALRSSGAPVSHGGRGEGRHGRASDDGDHGSPHGKGDGPQTPPVVVEPPDDPPTTHGSGKGDDDPGGGGGGTSVEVADDVGGHGEDGGGGDNGGSPGDDSHGDHGSDSHADSGKGGDSGKD